jgi:DNA-binding NarL/FixJ family response regulator
MDLSSYFYDNINIGRKGKNLIQILIVDDHEMTRAGIKFFIEQDQDIKTIGEAKNGQEAISLCASLKPDIVLMDVNMPILNGIEAAKKISIEHNGIKIIMLTSIGNEEEIRASFSAGANGYCLKDINDSRLIAAIKGVSEGDVWLDSSIAGSLLQTSQNNSGSSNNGFISEGHNHNNPYKLSEREMQIINLIVEGKTNQKIASELFLSVDTVKSHLKTIMDKLSVSDRTQAAVKAVREGLI